MTAYRYVVLGAGRQGTAAAYDLALRGNAKEVLILDAVPGRAQTAVRWIHSRLSRANVVVDLAAGSLDVRDSEGLRDQLRGADAVISAVPYEFNLDVTRAAIDIGVNLCDLGGHPETTSQQVELDAEARSGGITVVPDCGQAPGMATTLMTLALRMVPTPETLEVWDGGLPLDPTPPLFYRLTFAIEGLTNEYDGPCYNLRNGELVALEALTEVQTVDFPPPLGRLDAFLASGTGATFPKTFQPVLREFTSRVVRHPGHLAAIRLLKSLGLFSLEPVRVGNQLIVPRRVTERLLEPLLVGSEPVRDIVVVRVHCVGSDGGAGVRAEVDLMVHYDEELGLSAMQQCTGFDAAIVAAMLARGELKKGVSVREVSVDPHAYVRELAALGMNVEHRLLQLHPV